MAGQGLLVPAGVVLSDQQFKSAGTGLDTKRWTNGGGSTGNTQTINSNRLAVATGTTSAQNSFIWPTQTIVPGNVGILAMVEVSAAASFFGGFGFRMQGTSVSAGAARGNNSYEFVFDPGGLLFGTSGYGFTYATSGGTATDFTAAGEFGTWTYQASTPWWVRVEAVGHLLMCKMWADGTREPGWQGIVNVVTSTASPSVPLSSIANGRLYVNFQTRTGAARTLYIHRWQTYLPNTSDLQPFFPVLFPASAPHVAVSVGRASATTTGSAPATTMTATVGRAASTAASNPPAGNPAPNVGRAAATATANAHSATITPTVGRAAATATSSPPAATGTVPVGQATATGTATTTSANPAPAVGSATATAAAGSSSTAVTPGTGSAGASSSASTPAPAVSPTVGSATASGTGFDATASTATQADVDVAQATATSHAADPASTITPNVGSAAATSTGTPANAAIGLSVGRAGATAASFTMTPAVAASVARALATATGLAPSIGVAPVLDTATATALGGDAGTQIEAHVDVAQALANAFGVDIAHVGVVRDIDYQPGRVVVSWTSGAVTTVDWTAGTVTTAWHASSPESAWSADRVLVDIDAGNIT